MLLPSLQCGHTLFYHLHLVDITIADYKKCCGIDHSVERGRINFAAECVTMYTLCTHKEKSQEDLTSIAVVTC